MVEATNESIVEMLRRIQADLSSRMDRRDEQIERVFRRFDLADASQ